jgi:hypothetical protein
MHAANGNGGKTGSKGYSSKSLPPVASEDPEIAFQRSIVEAMPQAARLRLQAQLIPEEWSAATVLSSELSHKGGIALCYKVDLPNVVYFNELFYNGSNSGSTLARPFKFRHAWIPFRNHQL